MALSMLERLERLNTIFSDEDRPDLPDTSVPHIVDQDLSGKDLNHAKPISPAAMETTDSMDLNLKTGHHSSLLRNYQSPTSDEIGRDLSSEDEFVAACRKKVKPLMKAKFRPKNRNEQESDAATLLESIPKQDAFGNPLAEHFCQLSLVTKFPYAYIQDEARELVADDFFNEGKIWSRHAWEM